MSSRESIEIACGLLFGHDYGVVQKKPDEKVSAKSETGERIVTLRCSRCHKEWTGPISSAMEQQFETNRLSCALLLGHNYKDPLTGAYKEVCSHCGAKDQYPHK